MNKKNHRYPNSSKDLSYTESPESAVGIPAIWHSLRQMGKYMDVPEAIKASLKMNQKGGFDCPGCAWPDPDDHRSPLGEYCENGIKALVEEATPAKADGAFFEKYSVEELSSWGEFELGKSGRVTEPMYLAPGATHYKSIAWADAFEKIGKHLRSLENPNEAIFYTSGRTSNEAAFLYGAFVRAYGTNNLPDCSNMCHETSGYGLSETLGIGKGAVTLDDIHEADLVMVIGQNPGTNHPRMLTALENCKRNGGAIISVNPLKEAGLQHYTNPQKPLRILSGGTDLSDLYLQVQVNGDVALLKAIMLRLLEKDKSQGGIIDHEFIKNHTHGYDEFISDISKEDFETCVLESGVSEQEIRKAAELIAEKPKMIICWAMGITQHENGVQNVREIVNLLLLRGAVGKRGAGPCPVRGHSNVQGDRTMGIWEKMPEQFLVNLDSAFGIKSPREHGHATVPAIKAMHEGKAKIFIGMGGNFVSATPDTDYTAEALRKCDLTVHISTKPNRSHLVHGREAIILPTLGRSEIDLQSSGYQFISTENSMGIVQNSKGVLTPKSTELKSEVAIVAGIAKSAFAHRDDISIDWDALSGDYDLIRDKIEEVIPGFENYNNRVREKSGFYLPNGVKLRDFKTKTGKANFTINRRPNLILGVDEFRLMTVRAHDQYNTTLYGLDDRYRGIKNGREIILIHPEDIKDLGMSAGEVVDVVSNYDGVERSVYNFRLVPYDIPRKCLGSYFPEANPLVSIHQVNPETHTPISKNIIVKIVPASKN